jgi:hypothetical protein
MRILRLAFEERRESFEKLLGAKITTVSDV